MERLNRNRLLIFGILFIVGIFASALITRKCTAEKQVAPVERTDKVENIVVLPPAAPEADPGYTPSPTTPPPADAERRVVRPRTPETPTTATPLATSVYKGVRKGDWGMTINPKSELIFYIRNFVPLKGLDRTTVHLNDFNGITANEEGDYYVFTTDRIITMNDLNIMQQWAVYVGHWTDGHDKWIPHIWTIEDSNLINNSEIAPNNLGGYHFRTKLSLQKK